MKKIGVLICCLLFISCFDVLDKLSYDSSFNRTIEEIKIEYKGVVIKKFAPRKTMSPTHLNIQTLKDSLIDVSFNEQVMDFVDVGDSIHKIKNENIVFFKNSKGESRSFFYVKILKEEREDVNFPKEWKNKWMESTVED